MQGQDEMAPSDQLHCLDLNQADAVIEEYVSIGDNMSVVGSSVSQQEQDIIQVNAAMVADAVARITPLRDQVLTYHH